MSRRAVLGLFVFVAVGLSGCASPARVVRQDANSVVVAIPENSNAWPFYYQDAAEQMAAEYVPDPVRSSIQRVKVGEQTTSTSDTGRRSFSETITSMSTTSVADQYEYHLEFRTNSPVRGPSSVSGGGPPAATLSPHGARDGADGIKPVIPPLLPTSPPASPATNMPSTGLPGPGR
jgi:hypothetical protein